MSVSVLLMMASPGACAACCSIDLFTMPMLFYAKMPSLTVVSHQSQKLQLYLRLSLGLMQDYQCYLLACCFPSLL